MIAEAHEIRENQTFRQVAINQAKQLQNHTEETVRGHWNAIKHNL